MLHLTILICGQLVSQNDPCPAAWSAQFSVVLWDILSETCDLVTVSGSKMLASLAHSLLVITIFKGLDRVHIINLIAHAEQVNEIRRVKLSRVICDNSDHIETVQVYVMVLPDAEM